MRIEFFNPGMTDLVCLDNEDERLLQVRTTNPMNDDNLCFTAMTYEIEDEDFESDVRSALRRRYGKMGPGMYRGYEDVTDLYFDEDGNAL